MLKAKVSISRNNHDMISIRIKDCASGVTFTEVHMRPEEFSLALTGLSYQDAELRINGLEFVGKKCIREERRILCPLNTYDRELLTKWLNENAQEEGWIVDTYLGSKNSIAHIKDTMYLNYSVVKYVDMEADDENV